MGTALGNTIEDRLPCPKCQSWSNSFENVKFKNNTNHIQRSCGNCGQKINWVSGGLPLTKLFFGKYRGKTLEEIYTKDKGYLEWCMENISSAKIKAGIYNWIQIKENRLD